MVQLLRAARVLGVVASIIQIVVGIIWLIISIGSLFLVVLHGIYCICVGFLVFAIEYPIKPLHGACPFWNNVLLRSIFYFLCAIFTFFGGGWVWVANVVLLISASLYLAAFIQGSKEQTDTDPLF
mmetsp:Transcript_31460/g.61354  ORF Transcript_31460/g.61354 Transcript_31460/m.61354 type:complete len:125 (-) Transcript_31460:335-709(-)